MKNVTYSRLPEGITWKQMFDGAKDGSIVLCPNCQGPEAPWAKQKFGDVCPVCGNAQRVVKTERKPLQDVPNDGFCLCEPDRRDADCIEHNRAGASL